MPSLTTAAGTLTLDVLSETIVRVRHHAVPALPPEPPLLRYGFYRRDWPATAVQTAEAADSLTLRTTRMTVTARDGHIRLAGPDGTIVEEVVASHGRLRFALGPDDRFFGLGDQTRERLEHRGTAGELWVRNVASYVPIPFAWANTGVGVVLNTTRRLRYDFGVADPAAWGFDVVGGTDLDYYLLYGPTPRELFDRYTELTGRPCLPPRWGLGLFFICRTQADCREMLDDARAFRTEGIPCDAIGLEPGWMSRNYDFSVDKAWHPERFPVPPYAPYGPHNFLDAAVRMGFKPGLWLCNDYDLSWEAERRAAGTQADDVPTDEGAGFEQDEHGHLPLLQDKLTRRDEPWFQHLQHFVKQGVSWFKQDGAVQVNRHPDRLWGNGMADEEMHNLYPLLYSQQMHQGYREQTGQRPFGFTVAGWAGLQRWTNTWTGDTGGGNGPLGACLNLSLSGHGMSTPDMDLTTKEGIHFGFLLPWSQLNSWNYFRHPWFQGDELLNCFRSYARLRYRLLPYLYSCVRVGHRTGWPVLRAMPLEFPDDPETYGLLNQYLLGPALLVGAFTNRVYLPAGEWYDVWTSRRYQGPRWVELDLPADRGGPLLVRAGSLVPLGRGMDYVGQKPDDRLTVHTLLGAAGAFTLYEDDGLSYAYEQGELRKTRLYQQPVRGGWGIVVGASEGDYAGAPQRRRVRVRVHGLPEPPAAIEIDGQVTAAWSWDAERRIVRIDAGWRSLEGVEVIVR